MFRSTIRNRIGQTSKSRFQFKLPERLKGGRIERWAEYWKNVYVDYREAFVEAAKDCRERPLKASFYAAVAGGLSYAVASNPELGDFEDQLQLQMNDVALLGENIRNPEVDSHLNYLVECFNHDLIRRTSLGFFSILWVDNYARICGLYKTNCSYLKPRYVTFHERIVDVGFLGKWWNIEKKFKDFDINPREWGEAGKTPSNLDFR